MFVKLAVIACTLAAAASYNGPLAGGLPAAQYPAGVDPKACPNYPDCTNPAVAVNQVPQQYNAVPQYNYQPQQYQSPQAHYQPQYNQYNPVYPQQYTQGAQYSHDAQERLNRGEYIGDGDYHGEGLAEALAPGYEGHQQAYNTAPAHYDTGAYNPVQYNSAPASHYNPSYAAPAQPAQIPAGVDPHACPNYPFCY